MTKSNLLSIITSLFCLFAVTISILHLATDIEISSILLFTSLAIMNALIGLNLLKTRKLLAFFCFIPLIMFLLASIRYLVKLI